MVRVVTPAEQAYLDARPETSYTRFRPDVQDAPFIDSNGAFNPKKAAPFISQIELEQDRKNLKIFSIDPTTTQDLNLSFNSALSGPVFSNIYDANNFLSSFSPVTPSATDSQGKTRTDGLCYQMKTDEGTQVLACKEKDRTLTAFQTQSGLMCRQLFLPRGENGIQKVCRVIYDNKKIPVSIELVDDGGSGPTAATSVTLSPADLLDADASAQNKALQAFLSAAGLKVKDLCNIFEIKSSGTNNTSPPNNTGTSAPQNPPSNTTNPANTTSSQSGSGTNDTSEAPQSNITAPDDEETINPDS